MRGIRVIKALGRSPEQIQEYSESVDALQVREYGRSMLVARVALYQGLIVGVSTAVALAVGASQVAAGTFEPGCDDRLLCGADNRAQPRDAPRRADILPI